MPARLSLPINVYSAEGGQGTTTVAGVIAHFLTSSVESLDPGFELTWGSALLAGGRRGPIVRDIGAVSTSPDEPGHRVAVITGPSVAGAMRLARLIDQSDAVVLIQEHWRAISVSDLERAIRRRVDVIIPYSPRVARLADAGLLGAKLPNLTEFDQLKAWANVYC